MAFVRLGDFTIHYSAASLAGPAIIFCNSLGTDFRIWADVAERLAKHWRIVLYDKRGHGLSQAPADALSIEEHIDDLIALADHLQLKEPVAVVGLSIGGQIAMGAALRRPERVHSLVLVDTAARIGSHDAWAERIEAVSTYGLSGVADVIMSRWFGETFRAEHQVEVEGWRTMLLQTSTAGYAASCAAVRDSDFSSSLPTLRTPTLVVAGAEDLSTPPALVRATAQMIPNARFALIPSAGHLPPIEQPAALSELISQHLVQNRYV